MQWMLGYLFARRRSSRKFFSATVCMIRYSLNSTPRENNLQAQPVFRRKTTTVGLPSCPGNRNFIELGARVPITGGCATSTGGGGGVAQECHDLGTERFANGFAKGKSSFPLRSLEFEGFDSKFEASKALDGMPAFRSAILVVSFANILVLCDG